MAGRLSAGASVLPVGAQSLQRDAACRRSDSVPTFASVEDARATQRSLSRCTSRRPRSSPQHDTRRRRDTAAAMVTRLAALDQALDVTGEALATRRTIR